MVKLEDEKPGRRTRQSIRVRWDGRYDITDKGRVYLEGLQRICETCGVDQLPSGYRYGEEYFCEEHRPEHFTRDFRMLAARQAESGDVFQEWDCYWTKWETVDDYA